MDSLPAEPRGKPLGSFKVRTYGPPATTLVQSPYSSEESEVDSDPEQGRAALLLSPAIGRELPVEGRPEIPGDAKCNWRSWSPGGSLTFHKGNGYIKLPHSEALGISRYPEGRNVKSWGMSKGNLVKQSSGEKSCGALDTAQGTDVGL